MEKQQTYKLIVNRQPKDWPKPTITGKEIKALVNAPADWVVNQQVPGPGPDPEIKDDQAVDLSKEGVERFTVRAPKTDPGA